MNEDGTPIETQEPSTDNIPTSEGGETTTPEEVAELLHLDKPAPIEEEEPEVPEEPETPEETEQPEAPDKPETQGAEKPTPTTDEAPEVPAFELVVEDTNGDKFTLKPGDNLEEVLKEFEPKSNGQIFKIIDDLQQLRADKAKYDTEQETKAAEDAHAAALKEINDSWDKEIETLQGSKRIPVTSDGSRPERVDEVFKFMGEENDKRADDGRPLLRSFEDALDKLELRESKEAESKKAKEEKDLTRKRGGLVGGSSAPATSGAPVYKGGARNANEAIRAMGLIK